MEKTREFTGIYGLLLKKRMKDEVKKSRVQKERKSTTNSEDLSKKKSKGGSSLKSRRTRVLFMKKIQDEFEEIPRQSPSIKKTNKRLKRSRTQVCN